eukprot:5045368-Pleurochrysis_carterae.AAC.2
MGNTPRQLRQRRSRAYKTSNHAYGARSPCLGRAEGQRVVQLSAGEEEAQLPARNDERRCVRVVWERAKGRVAVRGAGCGERAGGRTATRHASRKQTSCGRSAIKDAETRTRLLHICVLSNYAADTRSTAIPGPTPTPISTNTLAPCPTQDPRPSELGRLRCIHCTEWNAIESSAEKSGVRFRVRQRRVECDTLHGDSSGESKHVPGLDTYSHAHVPLMSVHEHASGRPS